MSAPSFLRLLPVLAALVTAAGALPAQGPREEIVALEVHPASIDLADRFRAAQLVVTGRLADGSRVDLTRDGVIGDAGGLVQVDARGRVTPRQDGEGRLSIAAGGQQVEVRVSVRGVADPPVPGFVRDLTPAMTRIGCNSGGCHGAAKGKNGFKLSLRGYDPAADHLALTDDLAGRRVNRAAPERSLFLLKPAGLVPHEGGQRITPGTRDYELLKAWVEGGAGFDASPARVLHLEILPRDPTIPLPGQGQQMAVLATYDGGQVVDVTADAVIESNDLEVATVDAAGLVTALRRGDLAVTARFAGQYAATRVLVMGDRTGFAWEPVAQNNWIDAEVDAKLQALKTQPSGPCSDDEFLRRANLDLTGRPPPLREVRAFLADRRDSKTRRDEVIDRLIGGGEFVEHWTNKWSDLLQVNGKWLGKEGAAKLREWIRGQIASNRPYDAFVADLLLGAGSTFANPPAAYWKILRKPDVAMENTTQLFLGIRFNCNKCHDHPFERWTQDQHWTLAASFAQVGRENAPGAALLPRGDDNRPDDGAVAIEEIVKDLGTGEVTHPDRGTTMEPAFPFPVPAAMPDSGPGTRRERFARWLTSKENPYFARSFVNRLWSWFLGVGLIEPADDIRAGNPPTNPELLDRLTREFVASGFDVRALMRLICRSATYQRSLATNRWNADDTLHYAHALARRLPAETLLDAITAATGHAPEVKGAPPEARAAEFLDPAVGPRDGFLALFGRPPRESACECERGTGLSLGQALNLVNGPTLSEAIDDPGNAIARQVAFEPDARKVIDDLFLRFLCRPATEGEAVSLLPAFDPAEPAGVAALPPKDLAEYRRRLGEWEAKVPKTTWTVAGDLEVRSSSGAAFTRLDDGSWRASGARADTDTYTILVTTAAAGITGLRLEAIPDPANPKGGSGRADSGNFVAGEMKLTATPLRGAAESRSIVLEAAAADYSQKDFTPAAVADGNPRTGWAVFPDVAMPHRAIWAFPEEVGSPGGTLLTLTIEQGWGAGHVLGRFRISLTASPRPHQVSMHPDDLAAALARPPESRSDADRALIHRAFMKSAPDLAARFRLAAAQDLAWALATSPAFLFNR